MIEDLITILQAAQLVGKSDRTIERHIRKGELRSQLVRDPTANTSKHIRVVERDSLYELYPAAIGRQQKSRPESPVEEPVWQAETTNNSEATQSDNGPRAAFRELIGALRVAQEHSKEATSQLDAALRDLGGQRERAALAEERLRNLEDRETSRVAQESTAVALVESHAQSMAADAELRARRAEESSAQLLERYSELERLTLQKAQAPRRWWSFRLN